MHTKTPAGAIPFRSRKVAKKAPDMLQANW
jgi:hypothetical protein